MSDARRFKLLVDSVKDYAIFMLDEDGYVVSWNTGAQNINGYTEAEVVGRHFSVFYPREEALAGKPEIELKLAAKQGRFEEEGWRVRKDGSTFWANVVVTPIKGENDLVIGYSKVTRDLTERRRAEDRLRGARDELEALYVARSADLHSANEELRRWGHIFHNASWGITLATPDSRFIEVNRAFAEMHGSTPDEWEGRSLLDMFADESKHLLPEFVEKVEKDGHVSYESIHVRKDGTKFPVHTEVTAFKDENGKVLFRAASFQDMTEVREERQKFESLFLESPAIMALVRGPDFVFEKVNRSYLQLIGFRDVVGKPLVEALPELKNTPYPAILKQVLRTGEPYHVKDAKFQVQREPNAPFEDAYLDFTYQRVSGLAGEPYGILGTAVDVTEKVLSRKGIENERENFRNLFRQTPEMVCILKGPNHVFEFVNEAHVRTLGFDATGLAVREAQPESVEVHGILDDVYRTGVTAELHEIPVTVTNRLRYFNLTYAARRDEAGKINGIMILGVEVTDQVESRRALAEANRQAQASLKKLDAVVHDLSEGMVFTDASGNVEFMNPEALRIHGFSGLADMKRSLSDYPALFALRTSDGNELPFEQWPVKQALAGQKFSDFEVELVRADTGKRTIASYGGTPVFDQDGKLMLVVLTVRDVTEKKNTELTLKEAIRARDEFLSIASHELKTPLTSLMLQLQMANRSIDPEKGKIPSAEKLKKVMDVSNTQVDRLAGLVEDLLDVSRIGAGKLNFTFERVDLVELARDVVERHEGHLNAAGCDVQLKASGPVLATCDRFRIEQVLTNLLTNAAKYGSANPIVVGVERRDGLARVWVQDFGMGIAKENQDKIFERFERAIGHNNISGLGLGLYISREIVKAHKGRILVESELGRGSTFTVELPS